ncbi:unnamed protein product, partial [marine sediment metagenome]
KQRIAYLGIEIETEKIFEIIAKVVNGDVKLSI